MSSLLALSTAAQMAFISNPPLLVVSQTVAQSVPNSTFTTITMTNVIVDNYSGYNTGTSQYTFPVSGWYRVSLAVQWSANATPARFGGTANGGSINMNNTTTANDMPTASGVTSSVSISSVIAVNQGSTVIDLLGDQNSGAALNTQVGTSNLTGYNSYLSVRWINQLTPN